MQLEMVVIVMHQRESRASRLSPRDHFHAHRGRPVAIPLTAPTEEFSNSFIRIEHDDGYDAKELGHCNRPMFFGPCAPVD